jgi:dipeptidase E
MMTKTIFAFGGGTFGEPLATYKNWSLPTRPGQENYDEITTPVDKLILKATDKPHPRLLLIFTASEDGQHDLKLLERALRTHFEKLGASIDTLYLITQKPAQTEIKVKIAAADAIYVSGGNTFRLMRAWRRLGIDQLLRQAWEQGAVMSGMSAGSICWFSYGNSNSFYTNKVFRVSGMGWFNFLICPHYDSEPFRQLALKKMMKRTPHTMGIALDEYAALEIVDDTYRIHLFKPGARAQKCYWANGSYILKPISPRKTYTPIEEILHF